VSLRPQNPCAVWAVAAALLLSNPSVRAQPGGEDPANQYYRYNNTELEAVCQAMSPSRYVSGLIDGAWFSLPGGGRTYFYRSACYLELVRRTGRAELCPQVVERRTLLGDGSSHTPQRCAQEAAAFHARQQQSAKDQAAFAAAVEGAFHISALRATPLPKQNWQLEVQLEGARAGSYQLQVVSVRDGRVLRQEALTLTQPQALRWELSRAEVVGATALPNIFPMAVRMTYSLPATATAPAIEHSTGIQNFVLSAE